MGITKNLGTATKDAVILALLDVRPVTQQVDELAETLLAIAVEAGLYIDKDLVPWIRDHRPGSEITAGELRRWIASAQEPY